MRSLFTYSQQHHFQSTNINSGAFVPMNRRRTEAQSRCTHFDHAPQGYTSYASNKHASLARILSTMDVHKVYGLHADDLAAVQANLVPLGVDRVWFADDTLPAVEVRGAAKSDELHVKLKTQAVHHHVRDIVVECSRRDRYGALRCVPAAV